MADRNEQEELIHQQLLKMTQKRLKNLAALEARKANGDLEYATALGYFANGGKDAGEAGMQVLLRALGLSASAEILTDLTGLPPSQVELALAAVSSQQRSLEEQAALRQAEMNEIAEKQTAMVLSRSEPVPLIHTKTLLAARVEPYTEAELLDAVAEQSKLADRHHSLDTFRKAVVIYLPTGDTSYAFSFRHRDYFATTKDGLNKWLAAEIKCWPRAFFDPNKESKDGVMVKKTMDDILQECCTIPDCPENEGGPMIGRTDIQTSYYDFDKRQFVRAHCPLRPLAPERCEEFDQFLAVALPEEEEKTRLEDHMIAATDLSRPSAGVHLAGPKATAKSAVVEGIARLYGIKGSTDGGLFHNKHNDWTNPIVHEEEKPAKDEHGEEITAARRREVITKRNHTVNPKHVRQIVVTGYTRHFFSENGDRMFNFSGETEEELKATGERIDSFTFNGAAAKWIADKGGAPFVRPWIEQNQIARHILWLAKQRGIVNKGSRMLVEGRLTKSVALLQAQDRSAGRVLHCIARYVAYDSHLGDPALKMMGQRSKHKHRAVIWGGGKLAVNPNRLIENWPDVMNGNTALPLETVRNVIMNFSEVNPDGKKGSKVVKVDGKPCRFYFLKVQPFLDYASSYDIEDPDDLRRKIEATELKIVREDEVPTTTVLVKDLESA